MLLLSDLTRENVTETSYNVYIDIMVEMSVSS